MQVDWPGLLKWSLQYTDGTRSSAKGDGQLPVARPKEDLEFLEKAIAAAMGSQVDVYKLVKESADKLRSEFEADVLATLGLIQEGLDIEPELARNLHKLEVVDGLVNCLKHSDTLIQETDASILAFALANNEVVQKAFFDAGLLDVLMQLMSDREESTFGSPRSSPDEVRLYTKLFGAMSALVKHQGDAESRFLTFYNGLAFLSRLKLRTHSDRLLNKIEILDDHCKVLIAQAKEDGHQQLESDKEDKPILALTM